MNRILLVEDDFYLTKNIKLLLEREGYEVMASENVSLAKHAADIEKIDLCLIDVMLPDGNGFELCRHIRSGKRWPVIMISARDDEESIVRGLESGADDYVTKPFKPKELLSRIRANLRRMELSRQTERYICEDLELDTEKRTLLKSGEEIVLRNQEYRLLEFFMKNPEIVLKREVLLRHLWDNEENFIEDNTLSVTVKRLREKLGEKSDGCTYIDTIRGVGYRWNAPVTGA